MSLNQNRDWRMVLLETRLRVEHAEQSLAEADYLMESTCRHILQSARSVSTSDELLQQLTCSQAGVAIPMKPR